MSGALGRLPFQQQTKPRNPLGDYIDDISHMASVTSPPVAKSPLGAGVPNMAPQVPAPAGLQTGQGLPPPIARPGTPQPPGPSVGPTPNVLARAAPAPANDANPLAGAAQAAPAPAAAPAAAPDPLAATPGVADRVSTRVPQAKGLDYDPHERSDMKIDMESAKEHKDSFAKNSALITEQPGMNTTRLRTPEQISNRFVQHLKDNILHIHDNMKATMPEVVDRAKGWYDGANKIAKGMADQYGYSHRQMSGVLAALSPQKDWNQNVDLARRTMETVTKHGAKGATPEMLAWADKWAADASKDKDVPKASVANFQAAVNSIGNKPLTAIKDPYERAVWVRMHDEAHNLDRSYHIMTPEGGKGDIALTKQGKPSRVTWGSFGEISKALKVLDSDTKANISGSLGAAHKVRNFYNNIISPNSTNGDITVDTHAIAGALLRPLGGSTRSVAQGLGTGGNVASPASTGVRGLYSHYAEAYRQAAAERGMLPRQMQSITWEGTRGLFSPEQRRNDKFTQLIDDHWRQHAKGKVDAGGTRRSIIDAAGGIRAPEWART